MVLTAFAGGFILMVRSEFTEDIKRRGQSPPVVHVGEEFVCISLEVKRSQKYFSFVQTIGISTFVCSWMQLFVVSNLLISTYKTYRVYMPANVEK